MRSRMIRALAVLGLLALPGCASTEGNAGERPSARATGLTITVVEPAANSTVALPFEIRVTSNVGLGRVSTGKYHFHFWFDNNTADYNMVEDDHATITAAPTGPHTLHVMLAYPDHSPTGVEVAVPIEIAPGKAES